MADDVLEVTESLHDPGCPLAAACWAEAAVDHRLCEPGYEAAVCCIQCCTDCACVNPPVWRAATYSWERAEPGVTGRRPR